jgi:hypothetical protein
MKPGTVVAVLVFLGLAAGVAYVSTRKPERGISRITFATVDPASIDRIEFSGKTVLALRKEKDHWQTDKGKDADADAVKQLVDAIPRVESSDLASKAPDRYTEFEVDDAKGTHVVAKAGPRVVADFVVGKASGGTTAFRVGDAVYRVKNVGAYLFAKEASAWLDKKFFTDKLDAVSRVEVQLHGQKPYALIKKGNDWAFEDTSVVPASFRYDKGAASTLVSQLVNARAKDVLDTDPGATTTKLDTDADVLTFTAKDPAGVDAKHELRLGAAQGDAVYAQVSGRQDVFTVPEYLAKGLRKPPGELRDLTLMSLDTAKVEELELTVDKTHAVFKKEKGAWKIASAAPPAPKGFEFDPASVDRRLSALANSRAVRVASVTPAESGLAKPSATLVAKLDGKKVATLVFGKDTKDGNLELFYAKGNADGDTYLVTKYIKTNLTGGVETFKKPPPPPSQPNIDPNQLANLPPEVRAQLMQQLAQRRGPPMVAPSVQANAPPPPAPKK